MADSDSEAEEPLQLSAHALSALQEFYAERQLNEEATSPSVIEENWQLSQFWYDEVTATTLAEECLRASGDNGSIACVSCPTLYNKLIDINPSSSTCRIILLEYDKRFSIHGDNYVFYDYNQPLDLPSSLTEGGQFDIVAADPPFLSEECLTKTAQTIKHLTKDKILLCTGSVMEGLAEQLLGVRRCDSFTPGHTHNLANQFSCYTNYNSPLL